MKISFLIIQRKKLASNYNKQILFRTGFILHLPSSSIVISIIRLMLCKVINSKCLNGLLRLLDEGSFADLLAAGLLNGVVVDLCLLFTIYKSNVFVSSKDIF